MCGIILTVLFRIFSAEHAIRWHDSRFSTWAAARLGSATVPRRRFYFEAVTCSHDYAAPPRRLWCLIRLTVPHRLLRPTNRAASAAPPHPSIPKLIFRAGACGAAVLCAHPIELPSCSTVSADTALPGGTDRGGCRHRDTSSHGVLPDDKRLAEPPSQPEPQALALGRPGTGGIRGTVCGASQLHAVGQARPTARGQMGLRLQVGYRSALTGNNNERGNAGLVDSGCWHAACLRPEQHRVSGSSQGACSVPRTRFCA